MPGFVVPFKDTSFAGVCALLQAMKSIGPSCLLSATWLRIVAVRVQ
jgi:hypothetical protein